MCNKYHYYYNKYLFGHNQGNQEYDNEISPPKVSDGYR